MTWLQPGPCRATRSQCTLAYWHHPFFTSSPQPGTSGNTSSFWSVLYAARADVVVNAHVHLYERFAPQDPSGNADPTADPRVHRRHRCRGPWSAGRAAQRTARRSRTPHTACSQMTLHPGSYDWRFVPCDGSLPIAARAPATRPPSLQIGRGRPGDRPPGSCGRSPRGRRCLGKSALIALVASLLLPFGAAHHAAAGATKDVGLLSNGSFESSLSGWASYNASLSLSDDAAAGSHSALVQATASGTISIYTSPRPVQSTTAGAPYSASASVKGAAGKTLCVAIRELGVLGRRLVGVVRGRDRRLAEAFRLVRDGGGRPPARDLRLREVGRVGRCVPRRRVQPDHSRRGHAADAHHADHAAAGCSASNAVYVSPAGSDSAACTVGAPWQTIQHAFDAAGRARRSTSAAAPTARG